MHPEPSMSADALIAALNGRIVIEQAKGVLAERASISVEQALTRLQAQASFRNLRLVDVCQQVVHGMPDKG
jgi:AmiR/NasT family two-component response regulator